jgi:hypothetical protein
MTRYRMFHIPRNDVPEVDDLAPEYTGDQAELILSLLFFQYEDQQLDFSVKGFGDRYSFTVSFPASHKFPNGVRLTLKEYADYVCAQGDLDTRVVNVLSIRAIPNEELPDIAARLELLDRAVSGDYVRAFIRPDDESEQVRLWVEQAAYKGVEEFTPMSWASLWRVGRQPDSNGGLKRYLDMRGLPEPTGEEPKRSKRGLNPFTRLLGHNEQEE